MSKNIIFVFSGTGNSLWVAREISKELNNCEIVSMGNHINYLIKGDYDTIGFVYPTYGRGIPIKVQKFISNLDLQNNKDNYFYTIATCGNLSRGGNAVIQVNKLLRKKDITLNYGEFLDMFSNYIIMYDMRQTIMEEAQKSLEDLHPMIKNIKSKSCNSISDKNKLLQQIGYKIWMHFTPKMDKNFNVSSDCISCGICKKVCPVSNIELDDDKKPYFKHHCEQCVACIQNCPTKAINYKDKTQDRKRYIHPEISWKELAKLKEI